ncbi:hypothetical protein M413DRAFT_443718 [Hebeloma cylindrosporum]|uniref:Uncharacterized protein n=1 Tax=Hebeloma cylindrosporum TaxID=76867 RepID=A0A0C3C4P8_HEBCY|nr:hypothetical protein M413DRAFT_443718 [Hebeloma cylindrosporum h7]
MFGEAGLVDSEMQALSFTHMRRNDVHTKERFVTYTYELQDHQRKLYALLGLFLATSLLFEVLIYKFRSSPPASARSDHPVMQAVIASKGGWMAP